MDDTLTVVHRLVSLAAGAPLVGALLLVQLHPQAARRRRVVVVVVVAAAVLALGTGTWWVAASVGGALPRAEGAAALVRLAVLAALGGFLGDLVDRRVRGWREALGAALLLLLACQLARALDAPTGARVDVLLTDVALAAAGLVLGLCVAALVLVLPADTAPTATALLRPVGLGLAGTAAACLVATWALGRTGEPSSLLTASCTAAVVVAAATVLVVHRVGVRTRHLARMPAELLAERLAATEVHRLGSPHLPGAAAVRTRPVDVPDEQRVPDVVPAPDRGPVPEPAPLVREQQPEPVLEPAPAPAPAPVADTADADADADADARVVYVARRAQPARTRDELEWTRPHRTRRMAGLGRVTLPAPSDELPPERRVVRLPGTDPLVIEVRGERMEV